jgi:hypothetical protein
MNTIDLREANFLKDVLDEQRAKAPAQEAEEFEEEEFFEDE